jgi:hypothetical protein
LQPDASLRFSATAHRLAAARRAPSLPFGYAITRTRSVLEARPESAEAAALISSGMHTGSCLCGAVRFEVASALSPPNACHCTICRKQSGHFFASTVVPRAR